MNFIGIDVHLHSFTFACIKSELDIITLEEMKTENLMDYINRVNPKGKYHCLLPVINL